MEIDYIKILERIDAIINESGSSKISDELVNEVCYNLAVTLDTAMEFCEYYGCGLFLLGGLMYTVCFE